MAASVNKGSNLAKCSRVGSSYQALLTGRVTCFHRFLIPPQIPGHGFLPGVVLGALGRPGVAPGAGVLGAEVGAAPGRPGATGALGAEGAEGAAPGTGALGAEDEAAPGAVAPVGERLLDIAVSIIS